MEVIFILHILPALLCAAQTSAIAAAQPGCQQAAAAAQEP